LTFDEIRIEQTVVAGQFIARRCNVPGESGFFEQRLFI
jgi:hypothetical protein